jgi:hypothetical protein
LHCPGIFDTGEALEVSNNSRNIQKIFQILGRHAYWDLEGLFDGKKLPRGEIACDTVPLMQAPNMSTNYNKKIIIIERLDGGK